MLKEAVFALAACTNIAEEPASITVDAVNCSAFVYELPPGESCPGDAAQTKAAMDFIANKYGVTRAFVGCGTVEVPDPAPNP